jgi:hypothetical protein
MDYRNATKESRLARFEVTELTDFRKSADIGNVLNASITRVFQDIEDIKDL